MTNTPKEYKSCFVCEEIKPLSEFHKQKNRSDGYKNHCKECRKNKRKKNYNQLEKRCTSCYEIKPKTEEFFYKKPNKGNLREIYRAECKSCNVKRSVALKRKYNYGITEEEYKRMFSVQNGRCEICLIEKTELDVDHCHTSGKIRALLCRSCNLALGGFKDNIQYLRNATKYLEHHTEKD